MENLRPEVLADDFSAPENDVGIGELPRAYRLSAVSALASPVLTAARLPALCGPLGLGVVAGGLGLRVWAMRSLRGHYAHALRVVDDQPVIRSGPYRQVRHPGYLSALLICIGGALAARNAVPVVLTLTAVGTAYQHRMDAEDGLLIRELPGYAEYAETTGRMLPRVALQRGGQRMIDAAFGQHERRQSAGSSRTGRHDAAGQSGSSGTGG